MFIYRLLVAVPFVLFLFIPFAHAERTETQSGTSVYVHSSLHSSGNVTSVSSQGSSVHTTTESGNASVHLRTIVNGETVFDIHETSTGTPLKIEARSTTTNTHTTSTVQTSREIPIREFTHVVTSPPMFPTPVHLGTDSMALPDLPTTSTVTAEHISSTVTNWAEERLHDASTEHIRLFYWSPMLSPFTHTFAYVLSFLFP
jgi:hypothetical protein